MDLFNSMGSEWWIGVVEDRVDPEKLGRCRVRIFGYHTDDLTILPKESLPWAIPLTPITSASNSGIGSAPIGPIEGTWVMGIFLDGKDKQQPLMVGTITSKPKKNVRVPDKKEEPLDSLKSKDGKPVYDSKGDAVLEKPKTNNNYTNISAPVVLDNDGNPIQSAPVVLDGAGNPIQSVPYSSQIQQSIGPLEVADIQKVMDTIGKDVPYDNISSSGKIGKYGVDVDALIKTGYVKAGTLLSDLGNPNVWLSKEGIKSRAQFLASTVVQDAVMYGMMQKNYTFMAGLNIISSLKSKNTVGALIAGISLLRASKADKAQAASQLAAAHVVGPVNANKYDLKNEDGVSAGQIYSVMNKEFGGTGDIPLEAVEIPNAVSSITPPNPENPENDPFKSLNHPVLSQPDAFEDPSKVYPTQTYIDKSETNTLAQGSTDGKQSNILREKTKKRIQNILVANSVEKFSEPTSAYNAKYPYNQVIQTEAGHIIELDNSKGDERIHIYHKSGTYIEIDSAGTFVKKTVGDDYQIYDRNSYLYVKGAHKVTTEGTKQILVKDKAEIEVYGTTNIVCHKDITINTAENLNLNSTKGININAKEAVKIKGATITLSADSAMNFTSESELHKNSLFSVKSSLNALDGYVYLDSGKATTSVPNTGLPAPTAITSKTPTNINPPALLRIISDDNDLDDELGGPDAEKRRQQRIENGELIDTQPTETDRSGGLTGTGKLGRSTDKNEFKNYQEFPDSLKLSKYYTLGALSRYTPAGGHTLRDNRGKTQREIIGNLKDLAVNSLDVIKDKYPDMVVTSAFRAKGDSKSDHEIGAAADLQFPRRPFKDYYEIALWIKANVPHNQLLLEYQEQSYGQTCWVHIAYNPQFKDRGMKYGTLFNHSTYARNEFVNLGNK